MQITKNLLDDSYNVQLEKGEILMLIKNNLDKYYAAEKDGSYIYSEKKDGEYEYRYTFKIYEAKLEVKFYDEFVVYVRGENTCWLNLNRLILDEHESALLDYVETQHIQQKLKTRTIIISAGNF